MFALYLVLFLIIPAIAAVLAFAVVATTVRATTLWQDDQAEQDTL